MIKMYKWVCLFGVIALSGCSSDMSELDAYIDDVKKNTVGTVKPLPYIEPYQSYEYRSDRSPFVPLDKKKKEKSDSDELPERLKSKRATEPLEEFPLSALLMVGTLEQNGQRWALVRDSNGKVHNVTVGNYLGKDYGRIIEVTPERLTLIETFKDTSDSWADRTSELRIGD